MTDQRKTSEELIREARSRLSSGGGSTAPSDTPVEEENRRAPESQIPEPAAYQRPSSQGAEPGGGEGVLADDHAAAETPTWAPSPMETGPSRRPFFTTRWFRLAALLVIGLGYGFFTSLDDANRDDAGEIVSGGDLDVMTVQPGDCFDDPGSEDEVVFQLEAIPCSEPHDNEVFAVETLAGLFGPDYPGRQALEEHGYEVCSGPVFDTYVGTPYLDSALEVFTLTPTDDSWSQGDRDVVCVLYRLDFTKLNGPARNSGL